MSLKALLANALSLSAWFANVKSLPALQVNLMPPVLLDCVMSLPALLANVYLCQPCKFILCLGIFRLCYVSESIVS